MVSSTHPRPQMTFPTSPVLKDLFHRRSAVSLDFIVIGASIAGLSAAYNLKQAGHNVRVLEKSDGKLKVRPSFSSLDIVNRFIYCGVVFCWVESSSKYGEAITTLGDWTAA